MYTELDDGYYAILGSQNGATSSTTKPELGFGLLRRLLCLSAGIYISYNVLSRKWSRKRKVGIPVGTHPSFTKLQNEHFRLLKVDTRTLGHH